MRVMEPIMGWYRSAAFMCVTKKVHGGDPTIRGPFSDWQRVLLSPAPAESLMHQRRVHEWRRVLLESDDDDGRSATIRTVDSFCVPGESSSYAGVLGMNV
jgi:hypothetical protein